MCYNVPMPELGETELRKLPSVDRVLGHERVRKVERGTCRALVTDVARETLASVRDRVATGEPCPSMDCIAGEIEQRIAGLGRGLRRVINATGVVLHTNLGRAPLSLQAMEAMRDASTGYVNLELDLDSGERGSRHSYIEPLLCRLTGAEAALVVNNNASAVLLGLTALAKGKEVVVSRSQAVQIGGGFRVPDIMRQSGAKLKEVGTTNWVEVKDYKEAINPRTAALLRVHSSNFRITGFTQEAGLADLVNLGRQHNIPVLDDVGSGCMLDATRFGLGGEPLVQESVADGASLVFFSGDKLLGGPQAGIIVGQKLLVERLKRHPLVRATRIDKGRLGALMATLVHYIKGEAERSVPVWRMISMPVSVIEARARQWAAAMGPPWGVESGESVVGGGSLPGSTLPTVLLSIKEPARGRQKRLLPELARALRLGEPGVVCRIEKDRLLLDPRTVAEQEDAALLAALHRGMPTGFNSKAP